MIKEWLDKTRVFFTRYKIEHFALIFPQFRSTLLLLWGLAIFGLLYGRLESVGSQSQAVSIILTAISWIGVVFIISLKNPLERLKLLVQQIIAILFLLSFMIVMAVTYSLFYVVSQPPVATIQFSWLGGSLLLGYLTWLTIGRFFRTLSRMQETSYPGFASAPLLFMVLLVNCVWWIVR